MPIRFLSILLSFLIIALLSACSGSDNPTPYSNTIAQMTASIKKELADKGVTGGVSIALVDDQKVVWAQGFGYANAGAGTPATPDTAYRIASITKTFTGTMIMQLVEQGLLDIGDALTRYMPTFAIGAPLGFSAGGPITIRSMLTHHSGIPGDVLNGMFTALPDPGFRTTLLAYLQGEYMTYPVNTIFAYSNSAVVLLESVIANASGETLQTKTDALFQALGMDHSSLSIDSPKVAANLAKGYLAGQELTSYYVNGGTTGAIISSVQDMAKYIKMLNAGGMGERGRVLKPETLEMMLTPQNGGILLDFDSKIGLSWFLSDDELSYAGKLCWHDGSVPGFSSYLGALTDHKLGVVVLTNDPRVASADIGKQTLKLAIEEKVGLSPPSALIPAYSPLVPWDQARLDSLQGKYVFSHNPYASTVPYIAVRSVPGALEWINPDNGTTVHIVPKANGRLSAPGSQATEFEFRVISGRSVMIAHSDGQTKLIAEYYSPPSIPTAWTARLGAYQATNWQNVTSASPSPSAKLIGVDGIIGFGSYVLVPVSDTLAYVLGLNRAGGSSVQVLSMPPDGHEEIQLLGVRYRKN